MTEWEADNIKNLSKGLVPRPATFLVGGFVEGIRVPSTNLDQIFLTSILEKARKQMNS